MIIHPALLPTDVPVRTTPNGSATPSTQIEVETDPSSRVIGDAETLHPASITVTVNKQRSEFPQSSDNTKATVVVPIGNAAPFAGPINCSTLIPPVKQSDVAVGAFQVADAEVAPKAAVTVMSIGQEVKLKVAGVATTVTGKTHAEKFSHSSSTVNTTCCVPTGIIDPLSGPEVCSTSAVEPIKQLEVAVGVE